MTLSFAGHLVVLALTPVLIIATVFVLVRDNRRAAATRVKGNRQKTSLQNPGIWVVLAACAILFFIGLFWPSSHS